MPEVYTEAVAPETVEQYTQLLSTLSEEAQWWITGMGWGLEDLVLDANEVALLELLAEKNVPTAMSILTSPDIIGGVTWGEVTWAQGYEVESLSELLQDDIDELLAQQLLGDEGLAGINRLIGMAAADFEIAKGLYLIDNFGHPDESMFAYSVPDYNTQLYVLGQLAELEVPEGYEVAVVAAALDYGTLWTIADDEVKALIPEYAHRMIEFQAETDPIIRERGATWQGKDYPLEGQIALVWGTSGNQQVLSIERAKELNIDINFHFSFRGYPVVFRTEQFKEGDWDWGFIRISYLRDIGDEVDPRHINIGSSDLSSVADQIVDFYSRHLDYQWDESTLEINGQNYFLSNLGNPNYQWERFMEEGEFIGTSGEAYIDSMVKRAFNIPGIIPTFIMHNSGYYDSGEGLWKIARREMESDRRYSQSHPELYGWNLVPWNNWHNYWVNDARPDGRVMLTIPLPLSLWNFGLPAGIMYRVNQYDHWEGIQEHFNP